ncbi:DUF397 domain-containing protein [Streptomyces bugieae]|uniref:DUF397 domain-containing protein n=1 Tax=Streptomyces bugieae TaxID=3098223 RepID=A0ABU7P043_9ACTN|nr:DUF397 domain-containing protein [Streptomyces sp. DSM 41528]
MPEASGWRKASYRGSSEGGCVEVLDGHPAGVPVRDSEVRGGPVVVFPVGAPGGRGEFAAAVRAGACGPLP